MKVNISTEKAGKCTGSVGSLQVKGFYINVCGFVVTFEYTIWITVKFTIRIKCLL